MDTPNAPSAANANALDDDIIDLTDIVEQGVIPAKSADQDTRQAEEAELENQMADLFAASPEPAAAEGELGEELDALFGLEGAASAASDGTPPEAPAVMPDEDLPMPDMDDVDALLRNLGAPEAASGAAAPAPAGSAPGGAADVGMDDLDALLASIDAPTSGEPAASVASGPSGEADIDDLDSLLDSIINPGTASPAPVSSGTPSEAVENSGDSSDIDSDISMDELEALLDAAEEKLISAPDPDTAEAAAEAVSEIGQPPALEDIDLDALASALESEVPASETSAPESLGTDELDALLGEPLSSSGADEASDRGLPEDAAALADAFPLEPDLGNPLLVGEAAGPLDDLRATVTESLEALAADMALLKERLETRAAESSEGAVPPEAFAETLDELRAGLEQLHTDMQDLAENQAAGLAAAEARISALEAELAEKSLVGDSSGATPAGMDVSGLEARLAALETSLAASGSDMDEAMIQLENRLSALETGGEKAAAEAAARVIREEIAALLEGLGEDQE